MNATCWLAFLAEWIVMMSVVPDRREWLRTHRLETLIVFLALPAVLPGAGAIRLVRLSRLLRLVWVGKRSRQILSLEGLPYVALLAGLAVVGAGAAFSLIEQTQSRQISVWQGMWWAASTVTTVGYGDETPHTVAGKFLAIAVMVVGIGFVAVLTGAIAQRFIASQTDHDEQDKLNAEIVDHLREISDRLHALEVSMKNLERTERAYADAN